jgi:hypothetical protein
MFGAWAQGYVILAAAACKLSSYFVGSDFGVLVGVFMPMAGLVCLFFVRLLLP